MYFVLITITSLEVTSNTCVVKICAMVIEIKGILPGSLVVYTVGKYL